MLLKILYYESDGYSVLIRIHALNLLTPGVCVSEVHSTFRDISALDVNETAKLRQKNYNLVAAIDQWSDGARAIIEVVGRSRPYPRSAIFGD